jgi:hypothetical protein
LKDQSTTRLPLPEEPADLRAETRSLLENWPEEGASVIGDAAFVADLLWDEWGEVLAGMDRDRFLAIARGYSGELRLWVVGERPWDQCVAGLAGRVRRRLPVPETVVPRR